MGGVRAYRLICQTWTLGARRGPIGVHVYAVHVYAVPAARRGRGPLGIDYSNVSRQSLRRGERVLLLGGQREATVARQPSGAGAWGDSVGDSRGTDSQDSSCKHAM